MRNQGRRSRNQKYASTAPNRMLRYPITVAAMSGAR